MNIGNVGATTYNTWTSRTNGAKAQENNSFENVADKKVMTCTAQGSNEVMLRSDALMSYASPQTGESVNIYRADDYSKENPMYIIKGLDANGNEFEKEVDASKINPEHCSYNELMVLNVETGQTSPSDFLHAAALRSKANVNSYFEEADWISNAQALMNDYQTVGSWDSYLAMSKWLQSIMDYIGKNDDAKSVATVHSGRGNSSAEQAFQNVAPNAPDSVKKAWMEAAEETGANGMGLMENGKMSHISQLLVMKAVRRERGEENWSDVLGNSVGSALAAAKQALYQLENPLVPHSQRGGASVQQAIAKEKEFYIAFIDKLEALQESTGRNNTAENATEDTAENLDYAQAIRAKIEEIYEKVSSGDTEQSFAIGSQSFTLEEWDEFLAKFDATEEEIQKMQKEEIEKRTEQNMDTTAKSATEESTILTSESTMCTYPASVTQEQSEKLQNVIKDLEEQGTDALGDSWNIGAYAQLGLKVSQLAYACKEIGLSDEAAEQVTNTYGKQAEEKINKIKDMTSFVEKQIKVVREQFYKEYGTPNYRKDAAKIKESLVSNNTGKTSVELNAEANRDVYQMFSKLDVSSKDAFESSFQNAVESYKNYYAGGEVQIFTGTSEQQTQLEELMSRFQNFLEA